MVPYCRFFIVSFMVPIWYLITHKICVIVAVGVPWEKILFLVFWGNMNVT
jgi:hypothetical protein